MAQAVPPLVEHPATDAILLYVLLRHPTKMYSVNSASEAAGLEAASPRGG